MAGKKDHLFDRFSFSRPLPAPARPHRGTKAVVERKARQLDVQRLEVGEERPFSGHVDPNFFYTNPALRALYGSLFDSISANSGLFLLTGARGSGKTALLQR